MELKTLTIPIPSSKFELDTAIMLAEKSVQELKADIARHEFNILVYKKIREELNNPIIPGI